MCCLPFRPSLRREWSQNPHRWHITILLSLHGHGDGRWLSGLRLLASLSSQVDQILFWKVETSLRLRLGDDTIQMLWLKL
jgi:hypothetical protein